MQHNDEWNSEDNSDSDEDRQCPNCKSTNACEENGFICVECNSNYAICKCCHKLVTNMLFWGCFVKNSDAIPIILTKKEKRILTYSSRLDESDHEGNNESDDEDSDNYHNWYRPPYIPCFDQFKYVDDSTLWVFRCNDCNKHTRVSCD